MGKKWATVATTGYKTTLTVPDDGTKVEGNRIKYSTITTDLTDPLNTAIGSAVANLDQLFTEANTATSTNYTTVASDHATWLEVTGTKTITLLAAATATAGYRVGVKNVSTGVVTVARSSTDTIDGATSIVLQPKMSHLFNVNAATDGYTKSGSGAGGLEEITSGAVSTSTDLTITGLDTTYKSFFLVLSNGTVSTDNTGLSLQLTVAGSAYTATPQYQWSYMRSSGASGFTTSRGGGSVTSWTFLQAVGNGALETFSGDVWFHHLTEASTPSQVAINAQGDDPDGSPGFNINKGTLAVAHTNDGFVLSVNSGTMSFDYALYGLRGA